jgi:hypothetical protein
VTAVASGCGSVTSPMFRKRLGKACPVSSSRGFRILGLMRALVSLSGSILVSLLLCLFLKLENFIIYVSLCNSRIHVITLYSGHVCVYYASMLRC